MPRALAAPVAALALFALACADDPVGATSETTAPVQVPPRAALDPEKGLAPLPMDWLLDEDLRTAPGPDGFSAAEREWFTLVRETGGWSVTSEVLVPLTGPALASSKDGAVLLFDAETKEAIPLEVSLSDNEQTLRARPTTGALAPGRAYLAVVTGALRTREGSAMLRDPLFRRLLSDDVSDDDMSDGTLRLREAFAPTRALLDELAALGVPGVHREQLLAALPFTTTSRSAVWSSAPLQKEPFPGNHLVEPSGRVRVLPFPAPIADAPEMQALRERLSTLPGFSTTGALLFETTGPVERDTALAAGGVRLFRVTDDDVSEVTALERGVFVDGSTVWLRPTLTLEHSSRYAWVVTSAVKAATGTALAPQGASSFTQLTAALTDEDGRSQVLALTDDEAAALENTRQTLARVRDHLGDDETFGAAVAFDTLRVPEILLSYTDQLVTREVPVTLSDVVDATPFERGLYVAMPRVKTVLTGKMTSLEFLDPYTRRLREGEPVVSDVEFVFTIPDGAEPGEPMPVVLFGHGLLTSRELAYGIADKLASRGYAVFAIDFPLHGERSVCSDDLHCSGSATCAADGACINGDGTKGQLRKVASVFEHGPEVPVTTGQGFIDPVDVFASRDHFLQGLVDLKQSVRVLREADLASLTGGYVIDDERIGYAGISLGGIFGAALSALEPGIESFALNVPGADFVTMMEDSESLGVLIDQAVGEYGIEQGTPAWVVFETAARWALDLVDPLNLAHHSVQSPLSYVDPSTGEPRVMPQKRLLLQMAEGDLVVPNSGTHQLSARTGVAIESFSPLVSGHGFLFDPTSLEGARAREQVVDFLDGE